MFKTEIIAEAGLNHNGKIKNALKLIDIAKKANINLVKFQLFRTSNFINNKIIYKKIDFSKVYKRFLSLEFNETQWRKIINYAKKRKIQVFFSIFDTECIRILKRLKSKIVKIPSGEITNIKLLREINKTRMRVILSTGMSNIREIKFALKALRNCKVEIIHCVSEYPTKQINLSTLKFLKKIFKRKIGFSDHTTSTTIPALAVTLGCHIIEKHFTYYKNQSLGDHKLSLNPKELKIMTNKIRLAEKSLGVENKVISKEEFKLQKIARKGTYFRKNLNKGDKVTEKDLIFLRPDLGISANNFYKILNKKCKKKISKFKPLNLKYFI